MLIEKFKIQKGFTLIELLLVIVVISILAGVMLSVINVNVIRGRARDSQRKADMGKIQAALELYYANNRSYPAAGGADRDWIKIQGGVGNSSDSLTNFLAPATGIRFINDVPSDPLGDADTTPSTPCSSLPTADSDYRYNYRVGNGDSIYILTAIMEGNSSDDDSKCTALTNWSRTVCGATSVATCGCTGGTVDTATTDVCYGVQNP